MPTSQMNEVVQHLRRAVLLQDGAGLTDGQLLEDFISRREEAAVAALVRRHGPMVWGVCRRVLHNHHDAEDAFQATFLVLVRKAASIVPREMVANWLYGVAHQTALKARATAARRRERERQVTEMPEPDVVPQDLWHGLQPLLDQELSRLPDKYRVPIVLCDLEGMTRKEAARQLGCPEGTVAGRLARARVILAKRLTRHGLFLSSGSLAAVLVQNTATAGVPAPVVSSAINAAILVAAKSAATAGVVSAEVAALSEGVIKAMLLSKLKLAATMMLVLVLVGLGAGVLTVRALAPPPGGAERSERKASPTNTEGLTTVAAVVVQVSPDGKTISLNVPAAVRGEEAKRTDIRIADKTEITYHGVGLNEAKPTEGYHAQVWLNKGSADTAARVSFTVVDITRQGRSFVSGKVVVVSEDGKRITLQPPQGRDQESQKIDFTLNDKTKLTYAYTAKDAAKPTVGYQADLWLEEGTRDTPVIEGTVAKIHFVDVTREKEALRVGKLVGLAKDGNSITLEVPSSVRGEGPAKTEVKITPTTEITFQGVGPNGAKLTEGYGAKVWLQEGSTDTASKAVFLTGQR